MSILTAAWQVHISIPGDAGSNALILLRWIHLVAGITWVGLLYFFNLVSLPSLREMDGATRSRVVLGLMPRAQWWFRWSAVLTVLAGIAYWMHIVAVDARNANAAGSRAIWSFFVLWTVAFLIEMAVLMAPKASLHRGAVMGPVVAVLVVAAGYGYLWINDQGWESNRLLAIGIGGGIGWFMMFNVWGVIWRMQKKMLRWTGDPGSAPSGQMERVARLAALTSRINFALSFPMLFFMAAASHYPFLGR
jgi:uncharacterized membrane protein